MVVNSVKVYARIQKETKNKEKFFYALKKNGEYEDIILYKHGREQNQVSSKFRFHGVFNETEKQSGFFDMVAKPVVARVLQGFNGTIFAYGQTGSGKTYTMTGSINKYECRGVIPRCLQHIFLTNEKAEDKPTVYISYMEIYNEIAYDLLNPREDKTAISLEELSRVTVLEDKRGEAHLRNLSVLTVTTEEEAMRLLFLGETNRAIAETPLNEYSSRSHCIFTIYITSRPNNSKSFTYSKLNLIDLAGSERVHRSNITGNLLNEAKHINLSLHFLQQVILALSETKRTHIPYRNSLMTFILKDSLAGKCLTVMIATLDMSRKNIQETISTCKFAQRVSLITTDPVVNEVTDPFQEIMFLKNEIQELRKQLADKKPMVLSQQTGSLSAKQEQEIKSKLEIYLKNDDHIFKDGVDLASFQYCLSVLKDKIKFLENELKGRKYENVSDKNSPATKSYNKTEQKLRDKEEMLAGNDSSEVDFYLDLLTRTYEKAKFLSELIKECQLNIRYIREKLDAISKTEDLKKKIILRGELEYQQKIYRNSLLELQELKNETIQLEAGLAKAKANLLRQLDKRKVVENKPNIDYVNKIREDNSTERRSHCKILKAPHFIHKNIYSGYSCQCSSPCAKTEGTFPDDLYLDSRTRNHHHGITDNPEAEYCRFDLNTSESFCQNSFLPPIYGNNLSVGNNHFVHEAMPLGCCEHEFPNQKHRERDSLNFKKYLPLKQNPQYRHLVSDYQCGGNAFNPAREKYMQQLCDYSLCSGTCCDINEFEEDELPYLENDLLNSQVQLVPNKLRKTYLQKVKLHSPICQEKPHLIDKCITNMQEQNIESQNGLEVSNSEPNVISVAACLVHTFDDKEPILDTPDCQETLDAPGKDRETLCRVDKDKCDVNGEVNITRNHTYDIFLASDTEEFKQYMNNITLTGDEEVDREICNFYRSKLC